MGLLVFVLMLAAFAVAILAFVAAGGYGSLREFWRAL